MNYKCSFRFLHFCCHTIRHMSSHVHMMGERDINIVKSVWRKASAKWMNINVMAFAGTRTITLLHKHTHTHCNVQITHLRLPFLNGWLKLCYLAVRDVVTRAAFDLTLRVPALLQIPVNINHLSNITLKISAFAFFINMKVMCKVNEYFQRHKL